MKAFGIAGFKNSGKTTLIVDLIEELQARGLRIGTIKHAHHEFDIDHPGKDSYQHRAAGAIEVIVTSARRWAHICELQNAPEPSLRELLDKMVGQDIVLVEGFKHGGHPKLEVRRSENKAPELAATDSSVCMIVADQPAAVSPVAGIQVLDRSDIKAIADNVLRFAVDYRAI